MITKGWFCWVIPVANQSKTDPINRRPRLLDGDRHICRTDKQSHKAKHQPTGNQYLKKEFIQKSARKRRTSTSSMNVQWENEKIEFVSRSSENCRLRGGWRRHAVALRGGLGHWTVAATMSRNTATLSPPPSKTDFNRANVGRRRSKVDIHKKASVPEGVSVNRGEIVDRSETAKRRDRRPPERRRTLQTNCGDATSKGNLGMFPRLTFPLLINFSMRRRSCRYRCTLKMCQ